MSEKINNPLGNPPAFPQPITKDVHGQVITTDGFDSWQAGMSLRDWFAGIAMQGICSGIVPQAFDVISGAAYSMADAMLAAREKQPAYPPMPEIKPTETKLAEV